MKAQSPIPPRGPVNSDAERARAQLRQGERRPWEGDSTTGVGWFEASRRAHLRWRYPIETMESPEQHQIDRIWKRLVFGVDRLDDRVRSTLDTEAICGVVPVHSTASGRMVGIRRFPDGSSQLLVSHNFIVINLVLATLASFKLSRPTLLLALGPSRAPRVQSATPKQRAAMVRAAVVRDLLLQLDFHGIVASYRPRLSLPSIRLWHSAIMFAMAHEAAHLLLGDRPSFEPTHSVHLRPDGTIAESQWGPEWAQDRLALTLFGYATSIKSPGARHGSKAFSVTVNDRMLAGVVVSLVALHVVERGYFVGEPVVHGSAIDRLGSLMIEFNPLTSPKALQCIDRLLAVVDTCLVMEPLPTEAWDLLASLIRAHLLHCNEKRSVAAGHIRSARDSDVVLTARAEYEHTYDYLTSVQGTDMPNAQCLDLLRAYGRDALPQVLDLLGLPGDLSSSVQLARFDVARIFDRSGRIRLAEGLDRRTYVDTWANVICATINGAPNLDRMFYDLLGLGVGEGDGLRDEEN
jgi:hypothetical protein